MGFIMNGIKAIVGLFILLVLLGAIFGHHDTSTPAATTSQPTDTKTAYTRDNVNFISKDRVDENIKVGFAKPGDYKEVQVPLSTVVVGGYAPESSPSKQEEQTTPAQQSQPSAPRQTTPAPDEKYIHIQYDGKLVNKLGYLTPDPGKVYLVEKIDIENHGYSGVDTNPYKFKVEADNIEYSLSTATYFGLKDAGYPALDSVTSVTLKDGGRTSGYIVFDVPSGTSRYSLTYSHWLEDVKYN